jgi:hypothetical protein
VTTRPFNCALRARCAHYAQVGARATERVVQLSVERTGILFVYADAIDELLRLWDTRTRHACHACATGQSAVGHAPG